jgi:hypothetical protein
VAATQVEADVQKVIALLPTADQIAGSILNIIAAAEGNSPPSAAILATVQNACGQIQSDLTLANSLGAQYQTDEASIPTGALGKLTPAVAIHVCGVFSTPAITEALQWALTQAGSPTISPPSAASPSTATGVILSDGFAPN